MGRYDKKGSVQLSLYFTQVAEQMLSDCTGSMSDTSLTIYDGTTRCSPVLKRLCGRNLNEVVDNLRSTQNRIMVVMVGGNRGISFSMHHTGK